MKADGTPFANWNDGLVTGMAFALAMASWVLPETRWPSFAMRMARLRTGIRGKLSDDERAMIRVIVGERPDDWIQDHFWPEALFEKYLSWMYILASHRPGARSFSSHLIGQEHVDKALEQGRGVLLFTATFAHKDLMAKMAFAQAGYEVSHLSKDTHGFSETRFGKRWLNPIYTSIEERYLRERMVFSGSNTREVSAKVRERLTENAPVMITVTPLGRHVAVLPFLHGRIHIATGGLNFACENETPVLPVFTLRQADGGMTTVVGAALHQPKDAGREDMINALLADYVPRLETCVRSFPTQFCFPLTQRSGEALISPNPKNVKASDLDLQERPAA